MPFASVILLAPSDEGAGIAYAMTEGEKSVAQGWCKFVRNVFSPSVSGIAAATFL